MSDDIPIKEGDLDIDTDMEYNLQIQEEGFVYEEVFIDIGMMILILLQTKDKRMVVCNISDSIWSTMLATGLDQVFEFIEDTTTALLLIGS